MVTLREPVLLCLCGAVSGPELCTLMDCTVSIKGWAEQADGFFSVTWKIVGDDSGGVWLVSPSIWCLWLGTGLTVEACFLPSLPTKRLSRPGSIPPSPSLLLKGHAGVGSGVAIR